MPVTAFAYHADLVMVATKIRQAATGAATAQNRAGYDMAGIPAASFAVNQLINGYTQACFDQSWFHQAVTTQSNDPRGVDLAGSKQFADGDDILVRNMPCNLVSAHGIKVVNMRAGQSGGMRP